MTSASCLVFILCISMLYSRAAEQQSQTYSMASMSQDSDAQPAQSSTQRLRSILQKFNAPHAFPSGSVHPFSASCPATVALLNELIRTTDDISNSLITYTSHPFSNPKLVSYLRQYASISGDVHQVRPISAFIHANSIHLVRPKHDSDDLCTPRSIRYSLR